MHSDIEGELAVRIARDAVESKVARRELSRFKVPPSFEEKSGAFVTLNTYPEGELRGCIGYPQPFFPLIKSIVKAAEGATEDPRFPPLDRKELDAIVIEVSILTPPEEIRVMKPKDYLSEIVVGRDGLVVAQGPFRGLLLPQVPIDWNWDVEEFLAETCNKAGLLPDSWTDPSTRVYKFQAEIFGEMSPRGPVERRELKRGDAKR